jgi:hypothetical protein
VSSSTSFTVAPNFTRSPESLAMSMISAREIRLSSSRMRPSFIDCASLAAWYSAFSDRSPSARASEIAWMMRGAPPAGACQLPPGAKPWA